MARRLSPSLIRLVLRAVWLLLGHRVRQVRDRLGRVVVRPIGGLLRRPRWDPELVARYRQQFRTGDYCEHCAGIHLGKCRRIKRAVFRPDGRISEVEYWPWDAWPTDGILFESMLPDED